MQAISRTWQSLLLNTSGACVVIFNWGMTTWSTLFTRRTAFHRLVASIIGITMQENSRSNRRTSLKKSRTLAFKAQGGKCYYCSQPMWNESVEELTSRYSISPGQAKFLRCTGEHLIAHCDGGSASRRNIVAACLFCNTGRHARKKSFSPERFKDFVRRRMSKGGWHRLRLTR